MNIYVITVGVVLPQSLPLFVGEWHVYPFKICKNNFLRIYFLFWMLLGKAKLEKEIQKSRPKELAMYPFSRTNPKILDVTRVSIKISIKLSVEWDTNNITFWKLFFFEFWTQKMECLINGQSHLDSYICKSCTINGSDDFHKTKHCRFQAVYFIWSFMNIWWNGWR